MPVETLHSLSVRSDTAEIRISVSEATSVRDALDLTELRVRAACGGLGSCGACLIKVLAGEFNPATLAERQKLLPGDLASGLRLACQLKARGSGALYLERPAPASQWKSFQQMPRPRPVVEIAANLQYPYGLAVDLGTTHIRLSLWHRQTGRHIGSRIGINPQVAFGADVLTRLDANRLSVQDRQRLCRTARLAVIDGVRDILSRDLGEITPILAEIGQVRVVGNSVMLALICGGDGNALYELENWRQKLVFQPDDPSAWRREWRMPHADIGIEQPLAGFVGSDLLADLLITGMTAQAEPCLLADLGTNTEIAVWDGQSVWVSSVPGGPAFEGVGMRNGLAAEAGAIYKVGKARQHWQLETISNSPVRGFCASGFIDAIALLLREKHLKPSGRFAEPRPENGFCFVSNCVHSAIFASDIDIFQRAKAATAAAMAQLLTMAGLSVADLQTLWICGSLGQHLDLDHAMGVGLLPEMAVDRIKRFSHASLAGCQELLLNPDAMAQFDQIRRLATVINLGGISEYEVLFIENLRLQPLAMRATS
ncbi:ASKHA domain-containing protein [Methylomonas rivi]|uniref:ASKHA domain-containing protein n=1 Tax=Methylomonas rivi TaxID=2952226 RepID=A0ABT1U1B2_9GAMM|nr:ASKHA domain-containing protein [Methylomonas sp. WSC-6]MCQ8127622.1 ASKHA domain-containing protein [Methylomonas sp. WSC-6]